ncbi:MAG: matrixin family metalloprotease [Proteobacteria bacterium]|nr:MAG: matrixin family metalloprotease [Pseudomonadota bacterium]
MNQGWLVGACALVIGLSGCGRDQGEWAGFPVDLYAGPEITQDSAKLSDFQAAMQFWEKRAGQKLFNFQGEWKGGSPFAGAVQNVEAISANVIFYQSPWPFSSTVAGQTTAFQKEGLVQSAIIMINPEMHFCSGACALQPETTSLRNTYGHELGHFIGMNHVMDESNMMNPTVIKTTDLNLVKVDSNALKNILSRQPTN